MKILATRRRAVVALALLIGVAVSVGGGRIVWSILTGTAHEDSAAAPSTAGVQADPYASRIAESRRLARALIAGDRLTGLSVAVAVDGEIVWAEGFGVANVDRRTPVTPLTRFRLGALSKPLTAMAAAVLDDQGRLDLDAPVQRYVPAYPQKQWSITTRQLMGDVAGVHRIRGDNNDAMPVEHCDSLNEAVALLAYDPLMFEPGTEHRYSIWGWVLVSAVIEGAAGEPFPRVMARQVFEPLGMGRTIVSEGEDTDGVSSYTTKAVFGIPLGVKTARPDYSCVAGAGAFLSTPTDLVRLGSAMLKPGLLKSETIATFATPARLASGASTTYALGWTINTLQLAGETVRMVSHRGTPFGGTVSLLTFPDLGLAIAAAANMTHATGVDPFARRVAEVFTAPQNRQARWARPGEVRLSTH